MSLSEIEQHAFAYYVSHGANDLTIAGRFYPYGELVLVIEDKVVVDNRKFGSKVTGKAKAAGQAFLDHMVEKLAFSTTQNKFGGQMHQFQGDAYKAALKGLQESDPIIVAAKASGNEAEYWDQAFARLTA